MNKSQILRGVDKLNNNFTPLAASKAISIHTKIGQENVLRVIHEFMDFLNANGSTIKDNTRMKKCPKYLKHYELESRL